MTAIPNTQYAVEISGVDQVGINPNKPVDQVGEHQIMLHVEACGICFSDTKLLHAFDSHPRKAEVISGIAPEALAEIPGYKPGAQTVVPGHEPVGRIIQTGSKVEHFQVGDRVLVQADWKHLRTPKSNGAFGYNFDGALQEYVVIDERCVVSPSGEKFLIHVSDAPSAAAVGLIEPWATVEGSYAWAERDHLADDGRLLVITDDATPGLDAMITAHTPREVVTISPAEVGDYEGEYFDDIIYYGANADVVEQVTALQGTRGVLCVVLGGGSLSRDVQIDIGRVHYDFIRFCGTTGDDPAEGYAWIPADGELRAGDSVLIVGAAGPMGQMHTMRAVTSGYDGLQVTGTDISDARLGKLRDVVAPAAQQAGVDFHVVNTEATPLEPGYTYIACMVPVAALVADAVRLAGDGAIINAFAGIPAGTLHPFDLQRLIEGKIFLLGTSGSDVKDMVTVLRKIEAGTLDTQISLDAITGMAGFVDAINSVIQRTSAGKIMVYPALHDLGLTRLVDLPQALPHVAQHLNQGMWTKEAERALLEGIRNG